MEFFGSPKIGMLYSDSCATKSSKLRIAKVWEMVGEYSEGLVWRFDQILSMSVPVAVFSNPYLFYSSLHPVLFLDVSEDFHVSGAFRIYTIFYVLGYAFQKIPHVLRGI